MIFTVHVLRLDFRARQTIEFPKGQAGNVLRGALGTELDRGIFRPHRESGPSGLADPPRPFVFRVHALDGRTVRRGETFRVQVNLFHEGIGPAVAEALSKAMRNRISLEEANNEAVEIHLDRPEDPTHSAQIKFVTPTELKGADRPEFDVLFARIRDRISTLRGLYGEGPLDIDFKAMGERAAAVAMTRCDISQVAAERRSSRTGQTHPLGGFVGGAEYRGELGEFVPYLRAAVLTGVGRQTVWGKGEIEVITSA